MVKRPLIILIMLMAAVYAVAADKKYYEFPDAVSIKNSTRILAFDSQSGSRNITGATLKAFGPQACVDIFDGANGLNGAPGANGAPGKSGTIALGTVTTLAPSSPATVVFSGPSTARVVSFGLPKGDPGDPAAVDYPSVQSALTTVADSAITLLSATATEHVRFQIKNSGSYTVFGVTDNGLITIQNQAGVRLFAFTPTASQLQVKTSSGRVIFTVMSGQGLKL